MKIIIDFQEVDVSKAEADYYQQLVKQLTNEKTDGKEYFRNLFSADEAGIIKIVRPQSSVPWVVIHFMQQLQINQHLRSNDTEISKIKERLKKLEGV